MATVNPEIHQKFRKLTKRQEGDGHEIQVEVREDEEQSVKLQEIIDLLVAAGYFRARIKGLSSFDKVVGGMTWCIESCNVDLDVDLLFQENSTIGQKIALTEKIVAVLPKMKCPYRIEPHQIQGLDFIHIYPVIQWLVKRSMEFRQEVSNFVESFAINQFNKQFQLDNKSDVIKNVLKNISTVNEVYRPHRHYRRKTAPPDDLISRVQITLLEYGQRGEVRNIATNNLVEEEVVVDDRNEELRIEHLLSNMTLNKDMEYSTLTEEETKVVLDHYSSLHNEMHDGGVKAKEEQTFLALEQQKKILLNKIKQLDEAKEQIDKTIEEETQKLEEINKKQKEADSKLSKLEETLEQNPGNAKEVEELVKLNDNLRAKEINFREHCKQELSRLQNMIEETKKAKTPVENLDDSKELEEEMEKLKALRLQLAKKNRSIATLQRQLDEVPSRAELAQYQRRFLELYNQIAAKHKETKQYYTLYNSLEDSRVYIKKELSILNSISDMYPQAVLSNSGKEEFLKQLESIADGVKQSKLKVESKYVAEKEKRDALSHELQMLVEQQRRYVAAVRQLSVECKKLENISSITNSTNKS